MILKKESSIRSKKLQKDIRNLLHNKPSNNELYLSQKPVLIELNNISKSYGKKSQILENISTKIYKGDRIGIIGPNGEGKSTIAEIITRIKQPTSGKVIYSNKNIIIGIQFQDSNYPQGIKGRTMIDYYIDAYKMDIKKMQLDKLIDYFDIRHLLSKTINSLSGGQKQRLNIFLSIMNDPDLILLDELTTGLDIEATDRMRDIIHQKIIKNKEKSLILVSHSMGEVESICNRLWFIYNKKIAIDMKISEIVKKYGSVSQFTQEIFHEIRDEINIRKHAQSLKKITSKKYWWNWTKKVKEIKK